jgi:hypothetical protein
MPLLTVNFQITDDDKGLIERAATLADDAQKNKVNSQILAERGRTIEQVKRLYAIVMGFAVWSCVVNTYQCVRKLQEFPSPTWNEYSILAAQAISVVTLITLFYLGAERMLDRKYLQENSPVPTRRGLLWDLFTLGIIAVSFAILANTFPLTSVTLADIKSILPNADPAGAIPTEDFRVKIHNYFWYFTLFLLLMYCLDLLLLASQAAPLWFQDKKLAEGKKKHGEILRAYGKWIAINVVSVIVIGIVFYHFEALDYPPAHQVALGANCIALIIIAGHLLRFFVDFLWTFPFYYPPQALQ